MTQSGGWSFITDHWRLKVLALLLALVLFGSVAFAQNPITVRTVHVTIDNYQLNPDSNVIVTSFPKTVDVQVIGLADAVAQVPEDEPKNITASLDLTRIGPLPATGPAQTVQAQVNVKTAAPGVSLQQSSIPTYVTVDRMDTATLPIQVRDQPALGVTIDKVTMVDDSTKNPVSSVTITGASNLIHSLTAFVDVGAVEGNLGFNPRPVLFANNNGTTIKWPPTTIPLSQIDVPIVDVQITAHQTLQEKQAPLLAATSGSPACGYEISGMTWAPSQLVTLTGDPKNLANVSSITLSTIDVSGATSDVVSHQTVPLPPSTQTVTPARVTITVQIKSVFSCAATSPTPVPSPSPT